MFQRISLNQIFTLLLILLMLGVISGMTWFFYHQERMLMFRELQRHGFSLAENLAYNAEYGLLFKDNDLLEKLADGAMQDRDVLFAILVDEQGDMLVEKSLQSIPELRKAVIQRIHEIMKDTPSVPFTAHSDQMYQIFIPVFVPTVEKDAGGTPNAAQADDPIQPQETQPRETLGMAVVGISFDRVNDELKDIQKQVIQLAFLVLGVAIVVSRLLVEMIGRPIERLVAGTHRIARGDLSREVQVGFPREIGELAQSFNHMMADLDASRKELEFAAQTLEQRVHDRTQEIEEKNLRLTELVETMKRMQDQLIHSEKMASLGQLVAGIAHEINNPVNFISANITPLKQYVQDLKTLIFEYEQRFQEESATDEAIVRIKREIEFDFLVDDLDVLIQDVETGATRIKHIVQDLRNFSRLDEAELKTIDLHQSLDTTLNLLGHIYEGRITVHKDYGDLPLVDCYAGQLNQVFMNILANAGQAIAQKGNVWITTRLQGSYVSITIRDDGAGIPDDVLPKIFDPFFTTKDVGEGTGLGLSISYGIIEKHRGEITVSSNVGEGTAFTITIPRNPSGTQR
ncbi:putative signal transduction histidine kinase [Candidatus Moduliflexus flocculans]|uniref:histidine kinase n=1 Tax=Candidatus Moduliflexus flocculans TaxID=1499966 RepID=A0A081BTB9_9BACT|nr:putative signal transduction histidine kinase [Candidatus Moduliflexus flocculans]